MRYPWHLNLHLSSYLMKMKLQGRKRFPLVLMLEPTHQCNLACQGCGRLREYQDTLNLFMPLTDCIKAAEEAGAPIVSICGGEPFLYPQVVPLVKKLLERGHHVYLCTNGVLLGSFLDKLPRHRRLILNVHIDGLAQTHDRLTQATGSFEQAMESIKRAKGKGFTLCSNTTLYKSTDPSEMEEFLSLLQSLRVDGFLLSPAFSFNEHGSDIFLSKDEIQEKCSFLLPIWKKYRFWNTPVYLDFLSGQISLKCTPWANPTRNPLGWRSPCYLIADTHYSSFDLLRKETDWEKYQQGEDPRCANCMVHCGFEPSAVFLGQRSPRHMMKMMRWAFS